MITAAVRLDASREPLRRGLQAAPEAADPGRALLPRLVDALTQRRSSPASPLPLK